MATDHHDPGARVAATVGRDPRTPPGWFGVPVDELRIAPRLLRPNTSDIDKRRGLQLKVLDLFSGLGGVEGEAGGWSQAFRDRGHVVRTLDLDPGFAADICADIVEVANDPEAYFGDCMDWRPDVVLASPPCEWLSTLTAGRHWAGAHDRRSRVRASKTPEGRMARRIVGATLRLIAWLQPTFWVMENPVGTFRMLRCVQRWPAATVTYCRYGMDYRKPTDLVGRWPIWWVPAVACRPDDPCHTAKLTDVKGSDRRALIPYALGMDFCLAVEPAFQEHTASAVPAGARGPGGSSVAVPAAEGSARAVPSCCGRTWPTASAEAAGRREPRDTAMDGPRRRGTADAVTRGGVDDGLEVLGPVWGGKVQAGAQPGAMQEPGQVGPSGRGEGRTALSVPPESAGPGGEASPAPTGRRRRGGG